MQTSFSRSDTGLTPTRDYSTHFSPETPANNTHKYRGDHPYYPQRRASHLLLLDLAHDRGGRVVEELLVGEAGFEACKRLLHLGLLLLQPVGFLLRVEEPCGESQGSVYIIPSIRIDLIAGV